jgi:hypothetical protein
MKRPLNLDTIPREPAQPEHIFAKYNSWDIGKTFGSPFIWLWANTTSFPDITTFPMIIPASLDFGSVQLDVSFNGKQYGIKIYPKLVHAIKSINSQVGGTIPRSTFGLKAQVKSALAVIHGLASLDIRDIHGFRIEVTVQAPTLRQATRLVELTPFLQPAFWLDPAQTHPELAHLKLAAKLVQVKTLLANANWMHRKLEDSGHLFQRDSSTPTRLQLQCVIDMMAAFGWNKGLRKVTKSLDPTAWWTQVGDANQALSLIEYLSNQYNTATRQLQLVDLVRTKSPFGYMPCKMNTAHHYQVHNKQTVGLRCGDKRCKHHIAGAEVIRWIAQLVEDGRIPTSVIGYVRHQAAAAAGTINYDIIKARFTVPRRDELVNIQGYPAIYHTKHINGDGNCMFAAFATAYGTNISHKTVRREAVRWARANQVDLAPFLDTTVETFGAYLIRMRKPGVWGDDLMLRAISGAYHVNIKVLKRMDSGVTQWFQIGNGEQSARV